MKEIVVIGAGPAGSTAAETAAAAGGEVVLIDRKLEIGTPVQCGGFLPEAHELRELMPSALLPQTLVEVPQRCILNRTEIQRIYAPSGRHKEFLVDGRVVDRRAFDRYLASRAARAGARILPATRARLISGEIKLSGRSPGSISPGVVIGADGPLSSTAKAVGASPMELGFCLEYEMADVDIDSKAAEMYFGSRLAPGGYAWIIPLGEDMANVGVGVRTSYLGQERLPKVLDRFINDHPLAGERLRRGEVLAVMRGAVPASGSPGPVQSGNVLLAGDAAGHVMATSGGGIPLAMVAGRIAGEVAAGAEGERDLEVYSSRIYRELGRELERSVQIRRMVDLAISSDRLMDALLAALEPGQMKSIMRGQIPEALKKVQDLLEGRR
jgi:digeranylgeranylglycerophospholipid reductase